MLALLGMKGQVTVKHNPECFLYKKEEVGLPLEGVVTSLHLRIQNVTVSRRVPIKASKYIHTYVYVQLISLCQ